MISHLGHGGRDAVYALVRMNVVFTDVFMYRVMYVRRLTPGCSGLFCEIGGGGVFLLSTI